MTTPRTPEQAAAAQLDAYNARDIEAFVACYTDDVSARHLLTDEVIVEGKAAFDARYRSYFEAHPDLHGRLDNRIVKGNVVVDRETVTGVRADPIEAIAIYEVRDGLIARIWFA